MVEFKIKIKNKLTLTPLVHFVVVAATQHNVNWYIQSIILVQSHGPSDKDCE